MNYRMAQEIVLKFGEVFSCKQTQVETIKLLDGKGEEKITRRSTIIEKGFYGIKKYVAPYYILKKLSSQGDGEEYEIAELRLLALMRAKKVEVAKLPAKTEGDQ
jgi:hypothetical protein